MRKLFALLFVASVMTLASCDKKSETAGGDTAKKNDSAAPAPDPMPQDTAKTNDSAKAGADTAKTK